MLNGQTKQKRETTKSHKVSIFTIPLTPLPPQCTGVYTNFGEQIWCVPSEDIFFETFLPYGPMLAKTKNNCQKLKI